MMPKYITADEEMVTCSGCQLLCAARELKLSDNMLNCPRCDRTAIIATFIMMKAAKEVDLEWTKCPNI